MRKIYVDGVYDLQTSSRPDQLAVIKLKDQNGQNNLPDARSIDDAEVVLRVQINALSEDRATARSLNYSGGPKAKLAPQRSRHRTRD